MSQFVENRTDFSAECMRQNGRCMVVRENILFLDDGNELAAANHLQWKCGYVVVIPDMSCKGKALLYHTSCQRMTDVVKQIFQDCLEAPVSFPQQASEMTLGEMHRRCVTISYDDCRVRVEGFSFQGASQEYGSSAESVNTEAAGGGGRQASVYRGLEMLNHHAKRSPTNCSTMFDRA